jgi:uncharacterized protein (TIGR02453 family)
MTPSFSAKTVTFLRALKRNNNREWFHAHRDDYDAHVRGPMLAILDQLAGDLPSFAPELVADPKVSMFRQWRDTRFSEDKAPLKTNVAAVFPNRALGRMNGAGLYFEIAPGWVWIGGGMYAPETSQLQSVREHIADHYRQLDAIVTSPGFKQLGGLKGEKMSRVPRGFARDHEAAAYLQQKQFLGYREEDAAFAASPRFYQELVKTMKTLAPLVRFLNEPLVASRAARSGTALPPQPARGRR